MLWNARVLFRANAELAGRQQHVWKEPRALYIIQLDHSPRWAESGSCRISSETPAVAIYKNISTSMGIIVSVFRAKIEAKRRVIRLSLSHMLYKAHHPVINCDQLRSFLLTPSLGWGTNWKCLKKDWKVFGRTFYHIQINISILVRCSRGGTLFFSLLVSV